MTEIHDVNDLKKTKSDILLENNIKYQEWIVCQESIRKFDEMILDIRKYGFTLLTVLLSADGFLYAKTEISSNHALGIYLALMILIFGLFLVDRCHEVFLRGAVQRAHEIESELGMALSLRITKFCQHLHTATWGTSLYIFFCVANTCLILGVIFQLESKKICLISIHSNSTFIFLAIVIGIIAVSSILIYHIPAKLRINKLTKKISSE